MEKQIQVDGLTQTVLRSDPDGVKLLSSYPSISDDPGVEPWKYEESWEAKKVHAALQKWKFHQGGDAHRAMWSKLQRWYKAHPDAPRFVQREGKIRYPLATNGLSVFCRSS